MFGRKKDEEWEYTDQYFREENYGQAADKEYRYQGYTSTDQLMALFRPHLMSDEKVLCLIGGGKGNAASPFEIINEKKIAKKMIIAFFAAVIVFFIVVLLSVLGSGSSKVVDAVFLIFFLIGFAVVPVAIMVGVVILIVWAANGGGGSDYAVTDKRLLLLWRGTVSQISLNEVNNVTADVSGRSVSVTARQYGSSRGNCYWKIPNVNDPQRVKSIIDEAVRNYQANSYLH